MRIAIPLELSEYIKLRDGEIVFKKELPDYLKESLEQFKNEYEKIKLKRDNGLNQK